ncbi:MAG: M14-type cytosolic carboxypeptidase [Pseudomonadota bacterium]
MLSISSAFDGGNIAVIEAETPQTIRLAIEKDAHSDFYQWFYFRMTGARGEACEIKLENAGGASFTPGWNNYRAVASYDRDSWFRVDTDYTDGTLTITHTPQSDCVWFAYFAPYSMERHHDLMGELTGLDGVEISVLGHTLDGQPLDLVTLREPASEAMAAAKDKLNLWITARQHPGETMAQWWIEGFLGRLTDRNDPVAAALLRRANFHVVPNMNPDGSRRGHLRTNAAGINLNREWHEPTLEKSPEVFYVRNKMDETGVDFALDVHGDENLPYNFIAGAEGTPGFDDVATDRLATFKKTLAAITPDFQTKFGYPVSKPGTANLAICTNQMAARFGCLAMTLEMPFKDTADTPDRDFGWSPERCKRLGEAHLDAIYRCLDILR